MEVCCLYDLAQGMNDNHTAKNSINLHIIITRLKIIKLPVVFSKSCQAPNFIGSMASHIYHQYL